jgi:cytochrome c-type biogenesis protein CcmH
VLLLLVALVVGSGVLSSSPQTNAERAAGLDARLKCPSCQGLSVSQSSSASALAVRRQVRQEIDAGRSDDEVVASLEAQYGNAVLLTPPPGGLTDLLWLLPVAMGVGMVVAIVVVARRRTLPGPGVGERG